MADGKAAYSKVAAPNRSEAFADQRWKFFPYLVVVMLLLTAVSLFHVWSRVKVVELSLDVSKARGQAKEAQQENNRLRLEVASLKTPGRIEALARGQFGMTLPAGNQVVVVR